MGPERMAHPIIGAAQSVVRLSVIVPTLNEAENVDALVQAILAQATSNFKLEVLIADGGSIDGTVERVRAWEMTAPVRVIQAGGGRGLAGDVLAAAEQATSAIIVVMDADFSHAPASIPKLVAPILAGTSDMVIGSRYVPGGSTPDWPLWRRILSRIAGVFAWPLTDIHDPMSGFFAVRRPCLLAVEPRAAGFKIGLEIMAIGGDALRVTEVPITFPDRVRGKSKFDLLQMAAFGRRLMVLAGGTVSLGTAARFATVGVLGMAVDFFAFTTLLAIGASLVLAHVTSFGLATIFNYALNSRWSFAESRNISPDSDWRRYARFLTVCLLALFLRGGILATAVDGWGWPPQSCHPVGHRFGRDRQLSWKHILHIPFGGSPRLAQHTLARPCARGPGLRGSSAFRISRHSQPGARGSLLLELRATSRHRLSGPSADGRLDDLARHEAGRQH